MNRNLYYSCRLYALFSILFLLSGNADAQIITTYSGTGAGTFLGEGVKATDAHNQLPWGVYVDGTGNVYVGDMGCNRVRKINISGIITTIAGNGIGSTGVDGSPATTTGAINGPCSIVTDAAGKIYIADYKNDRVRIVNTAGIINTFAGGGSVLGDGGQATAAKIKNAAKIAIDGAGNVYICDAGQYRIRKVSTSGIITTIAGTGTSGFSGDGGPASAAMITSSSGIAADAAGNIYFCDQGNYRIRMISASGIITTIAGTGVAGNTGDGGPATAAGIWPYGLARDVSGNIYFSDSANQVIRRIDNAGFITTFAGIGKRGYFGNGGPAALARLNAPTDLAIDGAGNLYIVDQNNHSIRKVTITSNAAPVFTGGTSQNLTVLRNSVGNLIHSLLTVTDADAGQNEIWTMVSSPAHGTTNIAYTTPSTGGTLLPAGVSYTPATGYIGSDMFKVKVSDGYASDTITINVTVMPLVSSCGQMITTVAGSGAPASSGDGLPATLAGISNPNSIAFDAAGNMYTNDYGGNFIRIVNTSGKIYSIAGTGTPGYNGNGLPATATQLNMPSYVAVGPGGNIYLSDYQNHRIRKIDAAGIMTTIAGNGMAGFSGDGGPATAAQISYPVAFTFDATGNLYFNAGNSSVRKIDVTGIITTVAGTPGVPGYSGDGGLATAAKLTSVLNGFVFDADGNLYISDDYHIRKVSPSGIISTFAGLTMPGYTGDGGPATMAKMSVPKGLAADAYGNIFFVDMGNNCVRKVDPAGIISTIAGNTVRAYGGDNGPPTAASFKDPSGLAFDATGNLYIADQSNHRIRKINSGNTAPVFAGGQTQSLSVMQNSTGNSINSLLEVSDPEAGQAENWQLLITPLHGTVSALYTATSTGGTIMPTGLTYTPTAGYSGPDSFKVQVTDCGLLTGQTMIYVTITPLPLTSCTANPPMISTVAGDGTKAYGGDNGPATAAQLNQGGDIAFDPAGNMYIAEYQSNVVRKVSPSGIITTIAGTGVGGYSGDGGPATAAMLNGPGGLAVDALGNIYFSEWWNRRIRKINTSGIISTVAGNGTLGYSGDGGPATAAMFKGGGQAMFDASGNFYFCDGNDYRIRKINGAGIISTIAGDGIAGYSGDGGPATAAKLLLPTGIAGDALGNLYIADGSYIRKIDPSGIITSIAGVGFSGYSGDGGPATMAQLNAFDLVADSYGNLYMNNLGKWIRKVDQYGFISTIAGNGIAGYGGDNGPATAASFSGVYLLALDGKGNLYVNDQGNSRVRKISLSNSAPAFTGGHNQSMTVVQNSANNPINSLLAVTDADAGQTATWSVLNVAKHGTVAGFYTTTSNGSTLTPTGLYYTPTPGYAGLDSFKIRISDCGSETDSTVVHVIIIPMPGTPCEANPAIVTSVAGNGTVGYSGDGGPATAAQLNHPLDVVLDLAGNIYIADGSANVIRKVSTSGIITTIAGTGVAGFSGDGGPATAAQLNLPGGLFVDPSGNLFFNDGLNRRIRKISSSGIISTFAGNGTLGYSGDGGPATAAMIFFAGKLTMDGYGNFYFSDAYNYRIRKIDGSGIITTIAGNGISGYGGDNGPATAAKFSIPFGIAVDASGNVYVGETNRIRKIDPWGIITTFAGDGSSGYSGDGGPATMAQIVVSADIVLDPYGYLYFLDGNTRVRRVDPYSNISTIAGTGATMNSGDNGPATAASFYLLTGLAMDARGDLFISETDDRRIRKIKLGNSAPAFTAGHTQSLTVCANTTANPVNLLLAAADPDAGQSETWSVVTAPAHGSLSAAYTTTSTGSLLTPTGLSYTPAVGYSGTDVFKVRVVDCGGIADTTTINVTITLNSAGTITGPSGVCIGSAITLTNAVAGGVWSTANTNISLSAGVVNGLTAGTATVSYSVPGSCNNDVATTIITVYNVPLPITGPARVCKGSGIALTDAVSGGAWSSGNTAVASISMIAGSISAITSGTTTITYTLAGGCATTTVVTVDPPLPPVKGPVVLCPNTTVTLSNAATGGIWSSTGLAVSIGSATGIVSGIIPGTGTVIYSTGTACNATQTITVLPLPSAITGPASVCAGSAILLSNAGTGTWSSSDITIAGIGTTTGVLTGILPGTSVITFTLPTGCLTATLITVNPLPVPITGTTLLCGTVPVTLSDGTAGGSWSSSSSSIASVGFATGIVTGGTFGLATITYTLATGCRTTRVVTVNPAAKPITGAHDMCNDGITLTLSTGDAPTGVWTSTLVTVTTGGVVTAFAAGPGVITYTLPTGCSTTTTLTVNPLPAAITGSNIACVGQVIALSDTTVGGIWSTSASIVATITTGGVVKGITPGTAVISYSLSTGCARKDTITVYPSPGVITGAGAVCVAATIALSDTLSGGAWTSGSAGIATVTGSGDVRGVTAGTTAISYSTPSGCSATKTVTVLPLPTVFSVTGGGVFCVGDTGSHVLLSGSATGIRYDLYKGTTLAGSAAGTGTFIDFGVRSIAGIYTVTATNTVTTCGSNMSGSATIIVNPPVVPSVTISSVPGTTVCQGTQVAYTAKPVYGGITPGYEWKVNGMVAGSGSTYMYTPVEGDVVIVTMTSNATCVSSAVVYAFTTMSVQAQVMPAVSIIADPGINIVKGQTAVFTAAVTNGVPALTYQWMINGVTVPGATDLTYTTGNLLNYDKVSCMVTSNGVCVTSASREVQVSVNSVGISTALAGSPGMLRVVPNPNKGAFVIVGSIGTIPVGLANEEVSVEITDMLGQVVYNGSTLTKDGIINEQVQLGSIIANGMYLLNVRSSTGSRVFHIVVER